MEQNLKKLNAYNFFVFDHTPMKREFVDNVVKYTKSHLSAFVKNDIAHIFSYLLSLDSVFVGIHHCQMIGRRNLKNENSEVHDMSKENGYLYINGVGKEWNGEDITTQFNLMS
jgi:hypothetical protein